MDWTKLIKDVLELCVVPLLYILGKYFIDWIKNYCKVKQSQCENEKVSLYLSMLEDTVTKCVITTNQTFVDELKKAGKFGKNEMNDAFVKTYSAVMNILTLDAKIYLQTIIGDLDLYVTELIESAVKKQNLEIK